MFAAFIDLEKAFDLVKRNRLWQLLRNAKVDTGLIHMFQSIYRGGRNRFLINGRKTREFTITNGLK